MSKTKTATPGLQGEPIMIVHLDEHTIALRDGDGRRFELNDAHVGRPALKTAHQFPRLIPECVLGLPTCLPNCDERNGFVTALQTPAFHQALNDPSSRIKPP